MGTAAREGGVGVGGVGRGGGEGKRPVWISEAMKPKAKGRKQEMNNPI